MITRLEAYGYRCFSELSIDVARSQVLAGTHGAGETTVLDVPVTRADLLRQRRVADASLQLRDWFPEDFQ